MTLEGKTTLFKTLAISKIIHLSLITNVPTQIINELNKTQKEFIWNGSNPKIKHSTLCNKHENGGLNNVNILSKVISLQCSWIKRLNDNSSHLWKIIPSYLIDTYLGKIFKFHYLRDEVKIYLHLLVSHRLLHLKLSGIINVSK